ncbi:MAG: hypothetical protein ACKVQB_05905, partial [Bacteroidia bacterium]
YGQCQTRDTLKITYKFNKTIADFGNIPEDIQVSLILNLKMLGHCLFLVTDAIEGGNPILP